MQVIGFNFKKISAERHKAPEGKININMNITFDKLEKEEEKTLSQDVMRADFDFSVKYENIADFVFLGAVYFTATPEKIKEMIKFWAKEKKLPEEIRVSLINFVLGKCNIKAMQLEEEFNLPSHIPLPKVANVPSDEKGKDANKDAKYV